MKKRKNGIKFIKDFVKKPKSQHIFRARWDLLRSRVLCQNKSTKEKPRHGLKAHQNLQSLAQIIIFRDYFLCTLTFYECIKLFTIRENPWPDRILISFNRGTPQKSERQIQLKYCNGPGSTTIAPLFWQSLIYEVICIFSDGCDKK